MRWDWATTNATRPCDGRPDSIGDALAIDQWDVLAVAASAELRGLSDVDLLSHAATTDRTLVTENVTDFSPLAAQRVAEGGTHAGFIFTNPRRFNRASMAYPGNLMSALRSLPNDPPIEVGARVWWL